LKYTCNTTLYTQCKHNQITTHKIMQYTLYIVKYTLCKHAEITACKIEKYTSNTMLYAQVFTQCKNPRSYIVNTQSWSPPYTVLTHFYANEFTTWLHCVYIICKIDVSATPPQRPPPGSSIVAESSSTLINHKLAHQPNGGWEYLLFISQDFAKNCMSTAIPILFLMTARTIKH